MRRKLIAIAAMLVVTAVITAALRTRGHDLALKSGVRDRLITVRIPAQGDGRAFRFTRELHVEMKSRELTDMILKGRIWVHMKADSVEWALIKFDSLQSGRETMRGLPAVRFDAIANKLKIADSSVSNETKTAVGRFALDLMDQFRFFGTSDFQGKYESRTEKKDSAHFVKRKLKYLEGPYAGAKIIRSRHWLELDPDAHPAKLEGTETIMLGDQNLLIRTESSYLILADGSSASDFDEQASHRWENFSLDPSKQARAVFNEDAPPLDRLLATLRTGDFKDGDESMAWYRDMVRRINEEKGRLETIRQELPSIQTDPEQFKFIIGTLASSTQDDAGRILIEQYTDNSTTQEARALIMNSWTISAAPLSEETVRLLEQDNSGQALLALGAQVRKTGDDGQRLHLAALLIAKLQKAESDQAIAEALDAMGNSGAPEFLPHIQSYLTSVSEHVRAHAFLALRLIPGENVSTLLASGNTDPSSEVQSSVQTALNIREATL